VFNETACGDVKDTLRQDPHTLHAYRSEDWRPLQWHENYGCRDGLFDEKIDHLTIPSASRCKAAIFEDTAAMEEIQKTVANRTVYSFRGHGRRQVYLSGPHTGFFRLPTT